MPFEGYIARQRTSYWITVPGIMLVGALVGAAGRLFDKPAAALHLAPADVACVTVGEPNAVTVKLTNDAAARLESASRKAVGGYLELFIEGVELPLGTQVHEPNSTGIVSFRNPPPDLLGKLRQVEASAGRATCQ